VAEEFARCATLRRHHYQAYASTSWPAKQGIRSLDGCLGMPRLNACRDDTTLTSLCCTRAAAVFPVCRCVVLARYRVRVLSQRLRILCCRQGSSYAPRESTANGSSARGGLCCLDSWELTSQAETTLGGIARRANLIRQILRILVVRTRMVCTY
jgi:hypothetical protein